MPLTNWNPSDKAAGITLSGGNLIVSGANISASVRSAFSVSAGKWYWEITTSADFFSAVGVGKAAANINYYVGGDINSWGYSNQGYGYHNDTGNIIGPSFTSEVLGVALDMDAGTLKYYLNGVLTTAGFSGITGTVFAMVSGVTGAATGPITANFGSTAFAYTPPAGHTAGLGTLFTISGNVKDASGNNAARTVRAYRRSDGVLLRSVNSSASTGNYSIQLPTNDECSVMVLDNAVTGTLRNDQVARVIPA